MGKWLLLVSVLILAGCGAQPAPPDAQNNVLATPAAVAAKSETPAPDFARTSLLGVRKSTGTVRVGDDRNEGFKVFAAPEQSYDQDDLPPSITAPYQAVGWQKQDEGFGMILYEGRIAAAVYQLNRTNSARFADILALHTTAYGEVAKTIPGRRVRYWFWEDESAGQTLMICASEIQPDVFNVTVAIGTNRLMQALGMEPDRAPQFQRIAEDLIDKEAAKKTKSSNSSNRPGS